MNTEDLEKLYRKNRENAAPDFWDKIDAGLKPHGELSPQEKSSLSGFETDWMEISRSEKTLKKRRKFISGAVAAAVLLVCIPTAFWATRDMAGARFSAEMAVASTEMAAAETIAAETECLSDEAPDVGLDAVVGFASDEVPDMGLAAAAQNAAAPSEESTPAAKDAESGIIYRDFPASVSEAMAEETMLTVPEGALTVLPDTASFTEAALADTQLLAILQISGAGFTYNDDGQACGLRYSGSVTEILLEGDSSCRSGETILIGSPIVSDSEAGDEVLYQLQPGRTYILPLKKTDEEWKLVCPDIPQFLCREDGGFEFYAGYTSLAGEGAEEIPSADTAGSDSCPARKLVRYDDRFPEDLTDLVLSRKKTDTP